MKNKRSALEETTVCDRRKDARNQRDVFEIIYRNVSCTDDRIAKRSDIVDDFRRKLTEQRHRSPTRTIRRRIGVEEDKSETLNGQYNLKGQC